MDVDEVISSESFSARMSFSVVNSPASAASRISLPKIAWISFESVAGISHLSAWIDRIESGEISPNAI